MELKQVIKEDCKAFDVYEGMRIMPIDELNLKALEERILWHILHNRLGSMQIKIRKLQEQIDDIKAPSRAVLKRQNQRPVFTKEQLKIIATLEQTKKKIYAQKEMLVDIIRLKIDEIEWRHLGTRPDIEKNLSEQFEKKIKTIPPCTNNERERVIKMYHYSDIIKIKEI